jgi:hypothetical protein
MLRALARRHRFALAKDGSIIFLSRAKRACGSTAIGGRNEYCCNLDTALDPLHNIAQYVEKAADNLCRRGEPFRPRTPHREARMTTIRGSARYAGLLPVEPLDEPSPLHPTNLENEWFNQLPSRSGGPPALSRLLVGFCAGVAATLAWWSYGEAARQLVASSYPELGWLAPAGAMTAQKTSDTVALTASAAAVPDQQQLDEARRDVYEIRQNIDRIAASQEQIRRSIDRIAAGQELTRRTDETVSRAADATRITVDSRADRASLQPTERANIKSAEARPPQSVSERDKGLSAASRHDASCFPSASAVLQNHPGEWPSWTLKLPGHEGTLCWYAAGRPRGSDHRPIASDRRSETTSTKEIVGTTENRLSAPPAPYTLPPE